MLVALLSKGGGGAKLVATLIAALAVAAAVSGLAVVARQLGDRLSQPSDPPLRRLVRGVIVLELASGMPFFGWFVLFPLSIAAGLGSLAMALLRRSPRVQPVFAPPIAQADLRGESYAAR